MSNTTAAALTVPVGMDYAHHADTRPLGNETNHALLRAARAFAATSGLTVAQVTDAVRRLLLVARRADVFDTHGFTFAAECAVMEYVLGA